ncbi:2'-5' RNA ligase family protein [Variovorax sp. TBS-050B]|uniref:2'-5' RNA ligase family protein n=1 Tax=Variovorax sp. TBS-050B TaxID=2940551 RepID=UPI0024759152|nr:2'-5' RNA ligase family protein [Variovorax sp. TBS-050B]
MQAAIQAHRAQWLWPRGHYLPRLDRLHLTLLDLVEKEEDSTAEERLREALANTPTQHSFELALNTSRTWNNDVSVVQPAEHEALHALHEGILRAVRSIGLMAARPAWNPHVTIARESAHAARPPTLAPIRWQVREFRLVRSHRAPPYLHEPLAAYPLAAAHRA